MAAEPRGVACRARAVCTPPGAAGAWVTATGFAGTTPTGEPLGAIDSATAATVLTWTCFVYGQVPALEFKIIEFFHARLGFLIG